MVGSAGRSWGYRGLRPVAWGCDDGHVTVPGFVLQLIQTMVWPVTIVVLVTLLRQPLASLIARLQEGEFPGVKIRFTSADIESNSAATIAAFRAIDETGTANIAQLTESDSEIALTWLLANEVAESEVDKRFNTALLLTGTNPNAAVLSCASALQAAVELLYCWAFVRSPEGSRESVPVEPDDPYQALDALFKYAHLVEPVYRLARSMFEFRAKLLDESSVTDRASAAIFLDVGKRCMKHFLSSRYSYENSLFLEEQATKVMKYSRGTSQTTE